LPHFRGLNSQIPQVLAAIMLDGAVVTTAQRLWAKMFG
jgi:hypothetical protein